VPTYRVDLAYDGAGFHGFARQPGQRTVQGAVEGVLGRLVGEEVVTVGAGRTDSGVHARGQVMSFRLEGRLDGPRLMRSLNALLGPEVVVHGFRQMDEEFNARTSAKWRCYRYQLINRPHPDPLLRHYTWHFSEPLDLGAMRWVAGQLVGEHDFSSFCRGAGGKSLVRRVLEAGWVEAGGLTVFTIRAVGFCHQMVRSLVGWTVKVGSGRASAETLGDVLEAHDRAAAGPVAPPHGLILWEVGY
jgi:tRNA pseudouridine38-40 synthase